MDADDVIEVLDRLDAAGAEYWIDGGWGVDALLGIQTRQHDDLDLGVRLSDVPRVETLLFEFRRVETAEWPRFLMLEDGRGRRRRGGRHGQWPTRTRARTDWRP
ncbi:MAG: nucleotidyltransferase domain-containing protein [Mycobacteriales bacterium]